MEPKVFIEGPIDGKTSRELRNHFQNNMKYQQFYYIVYPDDSRTLLGKNKTGYYSLAILTLKKGEEWQVWRDPNPSLLHPPLTGRGDKLVACPKLEAFNILL